MVTQATRKEQPVQVKRVTVTTMNGDRNVYTANDVYTNSDPDSGAELVIVRRGTAADADARKIYFPLGNVQSWDVAPGGEE